MTRKLLARDSLAGLRVAVSASGSEDLGRLGLVESHFRLALGEIARSVIVSGGSLAYGGHLDRSGYTALLVQELHRYSRRDKPLQICLAWSEHRRVSLEHLDEERQELGLYGEIVCLDLAGSPVDARDGRSSAPDPVVDDAGKARALTAMRQFMVSNSNARVLIGGRRCGFQGDLPGIVEEALLSASVGQPLYLVGGFGGATFDTLVALGVDSGEWLPKRHDMGLDDRVVAGLSKLAAVASNRDWSGIDNGLSPDENRLLARTPRPSEIAALISLGLARRFSAGME